MKPQTLHDSPKYLQFVQDRNRLLERINLNTHVDTSRMLDEALQSITGFVSYMGIQEKMTIDQMTFATHQLSYRIDTVFYKLRADLVARIMKMRKTTFILTYLSELEAIARATQKSRILDPRQFKQLLAEQIKTDTLSGNTLDKQTWFTLSKLKDKIIQAFQRGIISEETPKEIVDRVKKSYPQLISYKRPPRALKPLREADKKTGDKEFDFYHDLVTDEEWEEVVKDATSDINISGRSADKIYLDQEGVEKYEWEIEQEVTDDFVQQVRQGQLEGASTLGINDFVWVAVIDKKTCDVCCLPRAGKTTSEIKAMLSSGELDKSECDAVVPPAHFHCRCDIAPVASPDPVEGPDWKSFDKWLET